MSDKEILDVEFLTPARVTVREDNHTFVRQISIDLANRKVYSEDEDMQEMVFKFLDSANPLPDDFFSAPDEIYEKVKEVYDAAQEVQDTHLGEK